jgi:hypothetical protein
MVDPHDGRDDRLSVNQLADWNLPLNFAPLGACCALWVFCAVFSVAGVAASLAAGPSAF